MTQPSLFPSPMDGAWSVTAVARASKHAIEGHLGALWIRGEIAGLKTYASGHWYFTIRDPETQIKCVMWRTYSQRVRPKPAEGTEAFIFASPSLWEEKGEFRLNVTQMLPTDGLGLHHREYERVRALLEKDGLFDPASKRPLPVLATRIAVVTSLEGAALRDIVTVARKRWPAVRLLVVGARVQGETAEEELVNALAIVNRIPRLDACIIGRGGGSKEDLLIFNREAVCRALAAVRVPTVSAVGHETDVTLTDFVADHRAATPSAAAELVVPDRDDLERRVYSLASRLAQGLTRRTRLSTERLFRTSDRLVRAMTAMRDDHRRRLEQLGGQLHALSPLRILERGYSVARGPGGQVLKRIEEFRPGDQFRLRVQDGEVPARVESS
ncbi:MAG TPA: exodeoxyribonuclease VII large subunit [Gemmatimonadales bacterium]|nr:exodeoxyribonuclease VII large subunit [Gemmatimonadales bacterium]